MHPVSGKSVVAVVLVVVGFVVGRVRGTRTGACMGVGWGVRGSCWGRGWWSCAGCCHGKALPPDSHVDTLLLCASVRRTSNAAALFWLNCAHVPTSTPCLVPRADRVCLAGLCTVPWEAVPRCGRSLAVQVPGVGGKLPMGGRGLVGGVRVAGVLEGGNGAPFLSAAGVVEKWQWLGSPG